MKCVRRVGFHLIAAKQIGEEYQGKHGSHVTMLREPDVVENGSVLPPVVGFYIIGAERPVSAVTG
jgi:hypothetical protein